MLPRDALEAHITRAKELLATVRHAAMATVNEDGSPHNTPVQFQLDETQRFIYWASNPTAQHSQNVSRTGQLFVVVYTPGEGIGLYLRARAAHELSGDELQAGLRARNKQRAENGQQPVDAERYIGITSQRMYRAEIVQVWVNSYEKDTAGNVTNDYRQEISRGDLLENTQ